MGGGNDRGDVPALVTPVIAVRVAVTEQLRRKAHPVGKVVRREQMVMLLTRPHKQFPPGRTGARPCCIKAEVGGVLIIVKRAWSPLAQLPQPLIHSCPLFPGTQVNILVVRMSFLPLGRRSVSAHQTSDRWST